MKQIRLLFTCSALLCSTSLWAQTGDNFTENYQPIKKSLNAWDPVRGEWLSEAIPAVINQEPIPVRTFPENITPMEMLSLVPSDTRTEIATTAQANQNDIDDGQFWSQMNNLMQSSNCSNLEATSINRRPVSRARSYGDPHLVTYDGERISFQAVGEFVLTKADNSRFEVQTRQRPVQDDFSLNTAVAMNVNGDRVCLYARDYPDNFTNTPVRINGQPVDVQGHYFLPNGGVMQRSGDSYIIDWPTGESVNARAGRSSGMPFYNVSVNIMPCGVSLLSGVLGNADGNSRNDFDGSWDTPNTIFAGNGNDDWQQSRSVFVTRNFADEHRVTQTTSLFDYAAGQSTFTFTDRSYPRVIRTVNDLDPGQRARARRACSDAGVLSADMDGCVYDNAYLNIEPCPTPPVRESIDPRTIKPVEPTVNTNPEPPVREPVRHTVTPRTPTGAGGGTTRPVKTNPVRSTSSDVRDENTNTPAPREPEPTTKPTRATYSEPVRSTPTRSTPTRSTPTQSTPTRSTPTRSTPTRSTPTRSTPTRSTPTRSTPTRSTPTRSTPTRSTPTRSTPTRGGGRGGR